MEIKTAIGNRGFLMYKKYKCLYKHISNSPKYDKETLVNELVNELSVHINHIEMHCEITEISIKKK